MKTTVCLRRGKRVPFKRAGAGDCKTCVAGPENALCLDYQPITLQILEVKNAKGNCLADKAAKKTKTI